MTIFRPRYLFTLAALLLLPFLSLQKPLTAGTHLDLVDTPTAATLARGSYSINVWGYDGGGILTKAMLGLHDNITLGTAFDIEHVIGNQEVKFNVPGVIARIKFMDEVANVPLLVSIGYDAFYEDSLPLEELGDVISSRLIYGPYLVLTKPVFMIESEQHFHFGVRVPFQPFYTPEDASFFIGFDFPLGLIVPMFEIEKIFFDSSRWDSVLYNIGIRFNLYDTFGIELNFMLKENEPANRILTFEYTNMF